MFSILFKLSIIHSWWTFSLPSSPAWSCPSSCYSVWLCSPHPGTHSHHTSEYSELFPGTLLFFGLFLLFAGIYPKGISSESTMVAKLSEVAECLRIFLFFCPHIGWVVLLCTDFQVGNHFPSEFWKHSSTVFYHLELLLMKMIVCILFLFKEFVFISILENLKMFFIYCLEVLQWYSPVYLSFIHWARRITGFFIL